MLSKARLKFLEKKMIILGPKTAILGPQVCRILRPHFLVVRGPRAQGPGPPGSAPGKIRQLTRKPILCALLSHHPHVVLKRVLMYPSGIRSKTTVYQTRDF